MFNLIMGRLVAHRFLLYTLVVKEMSLCEMCNKYKKTYKSAMGSQYVFRCLVQLFTWIAEYYISIKLHQNVVISSFFQCSYDKHDIPIGPSPY